jgi:hypothetical protein
MIAGFVVPSSIYLHPVKGPIFDQSPPNALKGSASGVGSISVALPSGETCKGEWQTIQQTQMEVGLASDWDFVYGQGYFAKSVQGSRLRAKATLVGNKGSEIRAEFFRHSNAAPIQGVAKDSAGNIFKVVN